MLSKVIRLIKDARTSVKLVREIVRYEALHRFIQGQLTREWITTMALDNEDERESVAQILAIALLLKYRITER